MKGVLGMDVPTQWGTFACGLEVGVIDEDESSRVVVLSELGGRRLTARVPRDSVVAEVA